MKRRDLLVASGSAALVRWLTGCDRLVLLDGERALLIDPVTSNADHYVYSVFGIPEIDPATHQTHLMYEDALLHTFDRAFVEALDARDKEHTLQCIGSGPDNKAISNAIWSGLPLVEILDALGIEVPASAVGLRIVGADRNPYSGEPYHAGLPIADLFDGPLWLVWKMNGVRLPIAHGAPYRLLVPGRYGIKNIKWPAEIAFVDAPHVSFWTELGWDEAAVYQPNTLVLAPADAVQLEANTRVRFAGTGYAGTDPVVSVEVSLDGGAWQPAWLDYTGAADRWVLWSWDWTARAGQHTLAARCTTASGAASHPNPEGSDPWRGYDGSMAIAFTVR